ncbi:MAG: hypothetical protein OXU51_11910 [Candidatus Poribacteria bacterium]|nr:hypothetical protein [Candidatus Poribacteria bacterium]
MTPKNLIKAWTEGIEGEEYFDGGDIVDGKILLNFRNTVYIQYRETQTDDGSVILKRVLALVPDFELPQDFQFGPGVRVLNVDEAGVGIDPYEYLDLP